MVAMIRPPLAATLEKAEMLEPDPKVIVPVPLLLDCDCRVRSPAPAERFAPGKTLMLPAWATNVAAPEEALAPDRSRLPAVVVTLMLPPVSERPWGTPLL